MIFQVSRFLPATLRESLAVTFSNFLSATHHTEVLSGLVRGYGDEEAIAVSEAIVGALRRWPQIRLGVRGRRGLLDEWIVPKYGAEALKEKFLTGQAEADLQRAYAHLVVRVANPSGVFIPLISEYKRSLHPDLSAILNDALSSGVDAVVAEFQALNPGVPEDVLRGAVTTLYQSAMRKAAPVPAIKPSKEVSGLLPQVSFLFHRHNIQWPEKYLLPIGEAFDQYLESLSDLIAVRELEKRLAVALKIFPSLEVAAERLRDADRLMWEFNKQVDVGWFLRNNIIPIIRKKAEEGSAPWHLVSSAMDVAMKSMSRDLGLVERTMLGDLSRSLVAITSAWTSGIAQLTQFVNTAAMAGVMNTLKVIGEFALKKEGREGLRRLATALGQYEALFYEDILRRRLEPEVLEKLVKAGQIPSYYLLVAKFNNLQDKVLRMVGLDTFEKMLRAVDLGAQREFLRRGLMNPDSRDFQAFLRLHKISIDDARRALEMMDAFYSGRFPNFDPEAIHTALLTTRATQMFYTGAELPNIINSAPLLDALMTFKKFTYLMGESYWREVIGRARHGDWTPLFRSLFVVAPIMYGGEYLIRGFTNGTVWRAYPKREGEGFTIVVDPPSFVDPKSREKLLRRISAYSPLLAAYSQIVLESGILGIFGEMVEYALTGNRFRLNVALEPVVTSHVQNILGSLSEVVNSLVGGDVHDAVREAARTAGRYGIPQVLASFVPVTAGMPPVARLATSLVGVVPRTLSRSYMQLRDDRERLRVARQDAVRMYLMGDPRFADLQAYLMAEFGPEALIKDSDVRRELKSRALAVAGLTQAEVAFKKRYRGDEHLDDVAEEILDEDLRELSEKSGLSPFEWLWP